jgi:protease I
MVKSIMTTNNQQTNRRVALLIEGNFDDVEVLVATTALQQGQANVMALGSRKQVQYAGLEGAVLVTSDATTTETLPDGFDAIIIPGGMAPDVMRTNMKTVRFVQRAFQLNKLIAAIGHGAQVLIEGDLLQGKRATGFRSIRKDMQHAGAQYVDEPLVIDGPLMTIRRPCDLPILMTALLRRLALTIPGIVLPDENDRHAEWWKLAEGWGGSSRAQIIDALNHALEGENYALQMCEQHAQKASVEGVRTVFQEICVDAQHHIQLLTARLTELGAVASPPVSDGTAEAQKEWAQSHDPVAVLLDVLDHLQARIVTTYNFRNSLTDPQTVDIFDEMEVNLARNERHLADLYHRAVSSS